MYQFDWKFPIMRVIITEGHTNQSTGEWVDEVTRESPITGDVQDISLEECRRYPQGSVTSGDRRIFTAAGLDIGDRLKITESDGSVTEWSVSALSEEYHMFGKTRFQYILRRI